MDYQTVSQPKFSVAGMSVVTENAEGKGVRDIGALWQQFFSSKVGQQVVKDRRIVVGLYTDYQGDASAPYRFVAGFQIEPGEDIPEAFQKFEVSGGSFAQFTVHGDPEESIGRGWQAVWNANLNRQYKTDYELYRQYCWENPAQSVTEIFISAEV